MPDPVPVVDGVFVPVGVVVRDGVGMATMPEPHCVAAPGARLKHVMAPTPSRLQRLPQLHWALRADEAEL